MRLIKLAGIASLLFITACAPAVQPTRTPTTAPNTATSAPAAETTPSATTEAPAESTAVATAPATVEASADRPSWQTLTLTNARTRETFTLADFAGKTVYIEPMATWCTNCRQQMNILKDLKGQFGDDYVFIGLSVETTLAAADLAAYADRQGYDWIFAVATPELLRDLTAQFGRTVANPPSTPHFFIHPDGTFSELHAGTIENAETLTQMLTEAGRKS